MGTGKIVDGVEDAAGELDQDVHRQGSDELESLTDQLKTKWSHAGPWTDNQNLALARIVKKVEDGPADGRSTGRFWASVEAAMEIEEVRPGAKAGALMSHYNSLVAGVRKHLPAGDFASLAGELKTKGSRADSWTDNQNLALARIVKNVEDEADLQEHSGSRWRRPGRLRKFARAQKRAPSWRTTIPS
jgi:hypothetical protein